MDFEEATQCTQNTQGIVDPRRMGRNNSGLSDADISDVMCILHPCSPAAFKIVASTAERTPYNVLQNDGFQNFDDALSQSVLEEQETFLMDKDTPYQAMDLALRFSAPTKNPKLGFVFGRNGNVCDIVLAADTFKRVSNMHFSIFINNSGVLMLQDMSTNGTVVDDVLLKGKALWQTRMLNGGSMIQILSPKTDEVVKFIVRIPSRDGHVEEYEAKFQAYMHNIATAEANAKADNMLHQRLAAANPKLQNSGPIKAPLVQNQFGMHWSGGDRYNVVGLIGKGAFATVYQLATKSEGQLYAAKELEKRKFMKNGILDRKLDNEMQIMKAVSHPNIVQYVDYRDHANHVYIIMEFVPCGDLAKYLGQQGVLPEELGKSMAGQVLDALAYLHKKKITHRDIKPDNILIANMDAGSFTIKLSDFGLSKVVKDNETFLKTFCGTLLYCAPEVFPHYDTHVSGKGQKRTRRGSSHQPSKFHGYSQSVDIWSFGAVLWYSLCLKPPFEGVADNTGRGMFDKIMMTPLNVGDLNAQSVSVEAVALLVEMLNTDPASRPSAAQCLRSDWLGLTPSTYNDGDAREGRLVVIEEEEEAHPFAEPDVASLSLDEQDSNLESPGGSEVSIHSASMEFLDPRKSKRFKSEVSAYREQDEMVDSSPELFHFSGSIPIMHQQQQHLANQAMADAHPQPAPGKLFGEISQSALGSSGVLGRRAIDAVGMSTGSDDDDGGEHASSRSTGSGDQADPAGVLASPSLLGAESMVRELKMDSPHAGGSHDASAEDPITPKVPQAFRAAAPLSQGNDARGGGAHVDDEATPKQPQRPFFSRQIDIPIPASFYYDPTDPDTHTLEYATKVSGRDYVGNSSDEQDANEISLPSTVNGSATENEGNGDLDQGAITEPEPEGETEAEGDAEPELEPEAVPEPEPEPELGVEAAVEEETTDTPPRPSQFVKPPPRLGKLVTTPDSFTAVTLNLSTRLATWGRAPSNTHPHPDKYDTRIPKRGIVIWHHAKEMEYAVRRAAAADDDEQAWMKLPDLYCVISTESSQGIWVNGVHLKKSEAGKMSFFGRLYTGDEIVVLTNGQEGKPGLKFVCEFYHGEAKLPRPEGAAPFVVETVKTVAAQQKVKREEKENVVAAADDGAAV